QNARLAARLTGFKIDIKSESEAANNLSNQSSVKDEQSN
ncbi:MAG: transcription termination/antitermination protein NusA, partial [Leuconostoc gelidum]